MQSKSYTINIKKYKLEIIEGTVHVNYFCNKYLVRIITTKDYKQTNIQRERCCLPLLIGWFDVQRRSATKETNFMHKNDFD